MLSRSEAFLRGRRSFAFAQDDTLSLGMTPSPCGGALILPQGDHPDWGPRCALESQGHCHHGEALVARYLRDVRDQLSVDDQPLAMGEVVRIVEIRRVVQAGRIGTDVGYALVEDPVGGLGIETGEFGVALDGIVPVVFRAGPVEEGSAPGDGSDAPGKWASWG